MKDNIAVQITEGKTKYVILPVDMELESIPSAVVQAMLYGGNEEDGNR